MLSLLDDDGLFHSNHPNFCKSTGGPHSSHGAVTVQLEVKICAFCCLEQGYLLHRMHDSLINNASKLMSWSPRQTPFISCTCRNPSYTFGLPIKEMLIEALEN